MVAGTVFNGLEETMIPWRLGSSLLGLLGNNMQGIRVIDIVAPSYLDDNCRKARANLRHQNIQNIQLFSAYHFHDSDFLLLTPLIALDLLFGKYRRRLKPVIYSGVLLL